LKVAILHEMFIKLGWAEKVVESMLKLFPEADLFTLIYDEKKVWEIFSKEKINSQVFKLTTQKIYKLTKKQRFCLPYMARSVEALDFSDYDLVLCSSSWFAHGAITKPETKFIVYYHSPARYLWDYTNEYKKSIWFSSWLKSYFLNKLFLKLRQWDVIASARVDFPIAASKHVQKRIPKYYKRNDSKVIYPPVFVDNFINYKTKDKASQEYYVTIAALTEWKRHDVHINAFNKLSDKKLKIIWVWNYESKLKQLVTWNNIEFVWYKSWDDLYELLKNAKWFIFSSEDDFWIAPIEAMASWLPIFWLKAWGLAETNLEWITWEFFTDKDWGDFVTKFLNFDANISSWKYKESDLIARAKEFSEEIFHEKLKELI